MKKILTVGAIATTLVLIGCSTGDSRPPLDEATYTVEVIYLADDTSVDCIILGDTVECDWDRRS